MTAVRLLLAAVFLFAATPIVRAQSGPKKDVKLPDKVSYYKDVQPILQQHCQGCHQPAKAQGGYVMTSFADLFKKTDNDVAGIVAGKAADSEVYKQITAQNGEKPAMPRGKEPLSATDVATIKK